MAISGSLKTLFESRTSSTTTKSKPLIFVPPSYFKVDGKKNFKFKQNLFLSFVLEESPEEDEVYEDDDDVLSISSDDEESTQIS